VRRFSDKRKNAAINRADAITLDEWSGEFGDFDIICWELKHQAQQLVIVFYVLPNSNLLTLK
jgi:hypothetical protein